MKKNVFLIIFLIILIVLTCFVVMNYNKDEEEDENSSSTGDEINYYDDSVSYYDYSEQGVLDVETDSYVTLPEDYLEYTLESDSYEDVAMLMYEIVKNSVVEIPTELLSGYLGDVYNDALYGAELAGQSLDEYIQDVYGYEGYDEYIEENTKYYEEAIKKDLVYQALAEELNITVTQEDIEEYFSERLSSGDTYDDLINLYGEELMYKYTLQDKVESTLVSKILY